MGTGWMRRAAGVMIAALVVASAVACGGGKSDEDKIKERVETFYSDFNKGDAKALINDLPPSVRGGCDEKALQQQLDLARGTRVELKSFKVNAITGNNATVTTTTALTLPGQPPTETTNDEGKLVKEGDGWYLDLEGEGCSNFIG